MDDLRFDTLTRLISSAITRRATLVGLTTALARAVVPAPAAASPVEGEICLKLGRKCKRQRRFKGCCGNAVCRQGKCRCGKKRVRCGNSCIPKTACCGGCPPGQRCAKGTCVAAACGKGGPCTVFVTSERHDGNFGGLGGADTTCQNIADRGQLRGTFRAWLSDSTGSPSTRFTNTGSTGPYVLVTGGIVARDWASLTSGFLGEPINVTENGDNIGGTMVYTNTRPDGTPISAVAGDGNCNDWSSGSAQQAARLGNAASVSGGWTDINTIGTCQPGSSFPEVFRIYCFQQG